MNNQRENGLRVLLRLTREEANKRVSNNIILNENGLITESVRICWEDGRRKPGNLSRNQRRANVGLENGIITRIYRSG